uniref:Uncharacterized protein n=1 Tax=Oryza meridionalis TaxID=40149 RepID=A0A0E0EYR4_9ORYZ
MLFQVGGQGARPTFFEMSAAQQLPASLRAALSYSLGVVLPYFKSKLQSIYNKEREARLQASLWGQGDVRFDEADLVSDQGETSQAQVEATTGEVSNVAHGIIF